MTDAHPRRLLLGGLLLLGTGAAGAAAADEVSLARAEGGAARLGVPVPRGLRWKVTALAAPARLVVDLPGLLWPGPPHLPGAGPIREARWHAKVQKLVLHLAGPVAVREAALRGRRLVVEVVPGDAAGFARLVAGPRPPGAPARPGAPPAPAPIAQAPQGPRPLVVLDPGHGGRDPGAVGAGGTLEKTITLAAALTLRDRLEAGGRARVLLTRTRDAFVPLDERVELARRRGAALLVSLHADSAPGARGASVYTLGETASDALSARLARRENAADQAGGLDLPAASPEVQRILASLVRQETRVGSARLARLAVAALRPAVPTLANPHREAGFVVLKAPEVPSLLVEMGFLSHPRDEAALRRPEHRARLAGALAGAIETWIERERVAVLPSASPPAPMA